MSTSILFTPRIFRLIKGGKLNLEKGDLISGIQELSDNLKIQGLKELDKKERQYQTPNYSIVLFHPLKIKEFASSSGLGLFEMSVISFVGSFFLGSSSRFAALTVIATTVFGIEYLAWFRSLLIII